MKKRFLSILLCLCMIIGLMPVAVFAKEESSVVINGYGKTISDIPDDYQGMVLVFEERTWGSTLGYEVKVGLYNTPVASAYAVELCYDSAVVSYCSNSGGTALNWKAAIRGAETTYMDSMLIDPSDEVATVLKESTLVSGDYALFEMSNNKPDETAPNTSQILQFDINQPNVETLINYVKDLSDENNSWKAPSNEFIELASIFFKLSSGKTREDFTADTVTLYPGSSCNFKGAGTFTGDEFSTYGAFFIGAPEPPEKTYEVTFNVKAGNIAMTGANVTVSGKSAGGNDVNETGVVGADGTVKLNLPASDVSNYILKISDVEIGGKNYTMASGDEYGKSIAITADTTTISYTTMREVTSQYSIQMKFTDLAGDALSLKDADIKFGAIVPEGTENGELSFMVPTTGTKQLTISNVPGFQNILADQLNFEVTAIGTNEAKIELKSRAAADAVVSITGTAPNQTINVSLRMAATNVTIPLPVPEADGKNITVEQAENLTLTFKPVEGSSANLKAEAGENGFTAGGSAVTVTPDSSDSSLAGAITVDASIPDGAYEMVVGGAGFDAVKLPVTVVTDYTTTPATRVVNVGGTAKVEDGKVTEITGGVTGSNTANADESGNGAIDLTGKDSENTTIVEGGSTTVGSDGGVTVPDASNPDVTDKTTGGLLDTEIANPTDPDQGGLKPSVVTDPIYLVEVEPVYSDGTQNAVSQFTAKVYLQNAKASSGTFGMSFDPTIFSYNKTELANAATLQFDDLRETGSSVTSYDPEHGENKGNGYVFFQWSVQYSISGGSAVDATSEKQLIATITLDVNGGSPMLTTLLQEKLDQRSIYTMDFKETKLGEEKAAIGAELDENIGSIWREVGTPGSANSVHIEKDEEAKATRGGFYQFSAPETVGTIDRDVQHDIRMQFKLPELMDAQRADFWVTEPDGTAINKAEIKIYSAIPGEGVEADYTIETDEYGYAHQILTPGTYYYTVTEGGHWAYPDGTALTETDGVDYDTFEVTADGVVMLGKVLKPETGTVLVETPIVRDYINPVMEATTYHSVMLDDKDTAGADVNASITSPAKAYNTVKYYFTVEPDAGYQWKLADGETLADVANDMSATLYTADKAATDPAVAFRGEPIKTGIKVNWDATKEQFYIEGDQISGDAIGEMSIDVDPLRAGDLVILVPATDRIEFADYTITATAGEGGEMKVELDATLTDGASDAAASDFGEKSTVTEKLSGGRTTSSIYSFKGTGTNKIAKVVINGVEQAVTDQQKENGYTYQFVNVSGDQTIYVSFTDETGENPLSDPYVAVESGPHGQITVNVPSADTPITNDVVDGPDKKEYIVTGDTPGDMTLKIEPDADYEIDSVMIDGNLLTDDEKAAAKDDDGYYTKPLTETLGLNKGDTHSVVVTFKPKGEASTHVIVTAKVVDGFGVVSPAGNSVYTVGATPTYLMTPSDGWELDTTKDSGAVMLDGKDRSDAVTAPSAGETDYSYTLPKLTGNVTLEVTFTEKGYTVQGKILIQALVDPTSEPGVTVEAATLKFVRQADAATETEYAEIEFKSDNKPTNPTSGTGKLLSFDHKIPVGVWTVTVSKPGYLEYEVTSFEVKEGASNIIYFGDSACDGGLAAGAEANVKPIVLICGDAAGEGKAIAANDVSMVVAGWLNNALVTNQKMGDLNESNHKNGAATGGSDTTDMGIVKNNMSKVRSTETYDDFCA